VDFPRAELPILHVGPCAWRGSFLETGRDGSKKRRPGVGAVWPAVTLLHQSWNDRLQWLVIGFSAGTTALAGVAVAVADLRWRIAPIVTSAVAAIAAGLTAYHKHGAQRLSKQRAADEIEHELEACTLGIGDYAGKDEEQRLGLLAQRVVAAQEAERMRALELEQPPAKPGDQPSGQAGPG
jgi:hypothetical protein